MLPPSRFHPRRVVRGDAVVTIRAIRPDDRDALRAGFHKLSPQSRYRRFQGHVGDLSPAMLRYLTEVDGTDHFAVVAVVEPRASGTLLGLPQMFRERWRPATEIVGVARIIRLPSSTAEVAVTVADALQGRGLGADLFEILVEHARRTNIEKLVAHVLPDNTPMLRLLRTSGDVSSSGDGTVTVTLERPAARRRHRRTPRAFRVGRVNFVLAVRWLRLTSR